MEEYLNLYHQKMWEIAYENLINTFFYLTTIMLFVLILIFGCIFLGKKWIFLSISSYFVLFLFAIAAEYVNSNDKIMNPDSVYNKFFLYDSIVPVESRLQIEYVEEQPLSSVDGELKKADVILFALSNPSYYDGLFSDTANLLTGEHRLRKSFLVALVGYEEKDGEWQSVDIRIAPVRRKRIFRSFRRYFISKKLKNRLLMALSAIFKNFMKKS